MDADSRRQKRQDDALSMLNVAVEAMNLAKEISSVTPAKARFGSVGVLLTMIRVRFPPPPMSDFPLQAHMQPGLDGKQSRLRRARAGLCRRM